MNSSGAILEEYNYDPWGRRRNPVNWSYSDVSVPAYTSRGFTGHEHLDMFNLIHMNGRIYDPETARFLSPDPFIQDPFNLLSYNRYSYCMNNPLKYSDPSGYVFTNKGDPCDQNDNRWSWWDHIASKWHYRRRWLSDEPGTHGGSVGTFNYTHSTDYNIGGNSTDYFNVEGGVSAHGGGAATATSTAYVPNAGNINNSPEGEEGRWFPLGTGKPTLWINEHPDIYPNTLGMYKMHIIVYGKMYSDYNWVQTYSFNGDIQIVENGSMANNGFQYPQSESGKIAYGKGFYQGNGDMFFYDGPNAENSFFAELSLFGKRGDNWYLIQSFTWGYSIEDGKTIGYPLTTSFFPSTTQNFWITHALFLNNPFFN